MTDASRFPGTSHGPLHVMGVDCRAQGYDISACSAEFQPGEICEADRVVRFDRVVRSARPGEVKKE